jgi:hypothetical protein
MKLLIIAFLIGISAYLALGNTVGEQDATQIESRFGWSDVKETAKSTKDGFVAGAHKVGGWISEKAVKAKDKVVSGYDYLKKKIKPKNEGVDQNQNLEFRTLDHEVETFTRTPRSN